MSVAMGALACDRGILFPVHEGNVQTCKGINQGSITLKGDKAIKNAKRTILGYASWKSDFALIWQGQQTRSISHHQEDSEHLDSITVFSYALAM